jgi:hypothetical protein
MNGITIQCNTNFIMNCVLMQHGVAMQHGVVWLRVCGCARICSTKKYKKSICNSLWDIL